MGKGFVRIATPVFFTPSALPLSSFDLLRLRMLQRVGRGFVYGNLWVGLSVASLSCLSFFTFDAWSAGYVMLSFFSTVAFYGYARWVETNQIDIEPDQHIAAWTIHNRNLIITLTVVSGLLSTYFWFGLPYIARWAFAGATLLSGAYTIPSLFNRRGVRYLAGFKLVHIAAVWTLVTLTIPALISEEPYDTTLWLHHLERFAFIIAITIPFDIRDTKTDSTDLLTLPMWLGIAGARNVALSAIAFVILLQLYPGYNADGIPWGEIAIYLAGGYLIHRSDRDLPDMYFSFLIEGLPVLLVLDLLIFS